MEADIFYWTGVILWSCTLTTAACVAIAATVFAPMWTFYRVKKLLWQWVFLAQVAEGKWSQRDLIFAVAVMVKPPCEPEKILAWLREVERRGKSIKG